MESILDAALSGLHAVFAWPNILYPIAGTLVAMSFAAVPGLSGVTLMALAIPFTAEWEPLPVILLFGALVGGATFTGSVTAILVNIPGNASNAATTLDGYPMARQGLAKTAIGCSAAASALGSTFGVLVLLALIPIMREAILVLGPPELLMLVVWGLTTIAVITRGSVVKGLAAAGLGFSLTLIGFDPRTAELRYTFDTAYLRDGISLVPVFLGIFAVAEITSLLQSGRTSISGRTDSALLSGSVRDGVRAVFENFGLFLRCSVIGSVIGIIPGVGGTVASFVAYGHAARGGVRRGGRFGDGDIRGVLAPEAANDAKDAGALVPTLAFGVPGGAGTAIFLTALTFHGLAPGKALMTNDLDLVFALIWSLLISNWLTSLIGVAAVEPLARLTTLRTSMLVPVVLTAVALGAYIHRGRIVDVLLAFGFGVVGYLMKTFGWSRVAFVVALVLGGAFESYLQLTLRLQDLGRIDFWTRPIAVALLLVCAGSLALPMVQSLRPRAEVRR